MTKRKTGTEGRTVTLRCAFCLTLNQIDMDRAADRPRCGECQRPFLLDRPVRIAGEDLHKVVESAVVPVLVDFYADWCGPCKVMAPIIDELAAANVGRILVGKVDTDGSPEVAAKLGIRGIPTFILFRDGAEAGRLTGAVPREALEGLLAGAPAT